MTDLHTPTETAGRLPDGRDERGGRSTSALGTVVRAGVGRRRVQTLVMTLTVMLAVTASVLAAGLLVGSQAPFDRAFAAQHGAHVTAQFAVSDPASLTATAHASGVTASAGPYPVLSLRASFGASRVGIPAGTAMAPMTVVGRSSTGGPVDDLVLAAGHWATGTGQIVLSASNPPMNVGDTIRVPGHANLTVVGLARSATGTADAWVSPAELSALGRPSMYQMLYRFARAGTDTQVAADRGAVASAAPKGSMIEAASYRTVKRSADKTAGTFVPFVAAFGILGVAMSVLIIGIVVSGTVGAATRRIGILKSLGFTPAQIVRAYVGQALAPATVGAVLGTVAGNLAALPVLREESTALGGGAPIVAPWISVLVPIGALALVSLTALVPALRAGRLRTVEAIAVGRTPRARRGRAVRRVLGRLPLPRPVSLGLSGPFARPGRSATMGAAVAIGTLGVAFAVGLGITLTGVQEGLAHRSAGQVVVQAFGAPDPGSTRQPAPVDKTTIAATIRARSGTRRYFSVGRTRVTVAGRAGDTDVVAYQGDSAWGGYQMVSGRWFHGPGEAVAPAGILTATGTRVGDTITLANGHRSARVRIVGEVFSTEQVILTDTRSLRGLDAYVIPESVEFHIDLHPGVDRQAYIDGLDAALSRYHLGAEPNADRIAPTMIATDTLVALLTLMLVAVAGLGVLNTVVLDTRDRVHDFGVYKAVGMSPRQTLTSVLTSVAAIGLVAGVLGTPAGVALHRLVVPAMAHAAGTDLPAADLSVYPAPVLVALVAGGPLLAALGALAPAGWAARLSTAVALRTE